ncbi:MAG: MetQ/NlpA family ABC transporter substrate-binding protein [Firmicutes bacterium]|jgi:ABC-type metal ion transport system, periplasmic component/surface antigen|nr:MetQ/NlpA family ABC transporter substrate-binding protein [Bacillota bacterium]
MKKLLSLLLVLSLTLLAAAGCGDEQKTSGNNDNQDKNLTPIVVGASPTPHKEILEALKDTLAEQGYDLQVQEYTDYIIPNTALENGEIDANYFQHITYLNDFNAENNTHLVSIADVHYEPMGLYPGKTASLEELADGATIGIPADPTNEARALLLLEAAGLITINPDAGIKATPYDITDNPKNLKFSEMEAAQLPRALADLDMAVINGNYALQANLSAATDALAAEDDQSLAATLYVNVLAVKEGTENDEKLKALAAALCSDTAKNFINEQYSGNVQTVF